jgi:hypothetical protein
MLKLIQKGLVQKDEHWVKLLNQNKYIFMPIYNVDGVADIEANWLKFGSILPRRKNMQ